MPYWQLYYHIVWSTKNREPLITPEVEALLYGFLRSKAISLGGDVFAINGVADHIHLVASIPPSVAVATFIGQVKGAAATRFNKSGVNARPIHWQTEYSVFSFDAKRLPHLVAYVDGQKTHHAQATVIPVLERMDEKAQTVRETSGDYHRSVEDDWPEILPATQARL